MGYRSKFRQPLTWFIISTIIITLVSACSLSFQEETSSSGAQFDSNPEAVVVYAYIHYPGVPLAKKGPADKYCAYLPSLLVWGDGFAFLDENIQNEYNSVLSGNLDSATLQRLWDILASQDFFTGWQAPGPNPAGTSLKIGAKLTDQPVTEYISGVLEPPVYVQLIETIKPALKPLADQRVVDKRVDAILKENENCNKYGTN
jgi:hypothetical protein